MNWVKVVFIYVLLVICAINRGSAATFTAKSSGQWDDPGTWSYSGADADGIPDNNDDVTINEGFTVKFGSDAACNRLLLKYGANLLLKGYNLSYNNAYYDDFGRGILYISNPKGSGAFNAVNSWLNNKAPRVSSRSVNDQFYITCKINSNGAFQYLNGKFWVSPEGELDFDQEIHLKNNFKVFGEIKSDHQLLIENDVVIGGTGKINLGTQNLWMTAAKTTLTIEKSADLTISMNDLGGSGITLSNYGSLYLQMNNAGIEKLINQNYATFIIGGQFSCNNWDVGQVGNTVSFSNKDGYLAIPNQTYYNLEVGNRSNNVDQDIVVLNDFIINTTTSIKNTITIGGDWVHNSGNVDNTGKVILNGPKDQHLNSKVLESVEFNELEINKASTSVIADKQLVVRGSLIMKSGNILMGDNILEIGINYTQIGNIVHTNGSVYGKIKKWYQTGNFGANTFPLASGLYNDLVLNIDLGFVTQYGALLIQFIEADPGNKGLSPGLNVSGKTIYNTFSDGYWSIERVENLAFNSIETIQVTAGALKSFSHQSSNRLVFRESGAWESGSPTGINYTPSPVRYKVTGPKITGDFDIALGSPNNCTLAIPTKIIGKPEVCTNAIEQYIVNQVAPSGNSKFFWEVDGGDIVSPAGATKAPNGKSIIELSSSFASSKIGVKWSSIGKYGSIKVKEKAASCGYGPFIEQVARVNSIQPQALIGDKAVPELTSNVAYVVPGPISGYKYNYTIEGGTVSYLSPATDTINVDWDSKGIGRIVVTAEDLANSCPVSPSYTKEVEIYDVIETVASGNWKNNTSSRWKSGVEPKKTESARIKDRHSIVINDDHEVKNLIIETRGVLRLNGKKVTINDNLILDGSIEGPGVIEYKGLFGSIKGTPKEPIGTKGTKEVNVTISGVAVIERGTKITFNGNFDIQNSTVINNADITIGGKVDGYLGVWKNESGTPSDPVRLVVEGDAFSNNQSSLSASSLYNIVEYSGSGLQFIKDPDNGTYFSLVLSGDNTKVVSAPLNINGDFKILNASGTNAPILMATVENVVTFSGTVDQEIDLSGLQTTTSGGMTWAMPNMKVKKGKGVLHLKSNLDVGEKLYLESGILDAGSNTVYIKSNDPKAIEGGNNNTFIQGNLTRNMQGGVSYPFYTGGGQDYKRIDITTTGNSVFQVRANHARYPDVEHLNDAGPGGVLKKVSTMEYWNVARISGTTPAKVRLYWNSLEGSGINDLVDLRVAHYNGTNWESFGNGAHFYDAVQGYGYIENQYPISSFSPIAFGSGSDSEAVNPLPVELLYFKAAKVAEGVLLKWGTESEINNDKFEIQRSSNALEGHYETIGAIKGKGTLSSASTYQFVDKKPLPNGSYYRLKQVDFDGAYVYSPVEYVGQFEGAISNCMLYPNPLVGGLVTIEGIEVPERSQVHIYSSNGIKIGSVQANEYYRRHNGISIDISGFGLRPGVYLLRMMESGIELMQFKVILQE